MVSQQTLETGPRTFSQWTWKQVNDLLIMFLWFFLRPFSLASEAQGFSAGARSGCASAAGLLLHSVDRVAVALVAW